MAFDEGDLLDQVNSLRVQLATAKQQYEPIVERVQQFKANFGVKERQNGEIVIDFEKMVERLGPVACLELRAVIDERWRITGEAGQKPRIRVAAEAAA
jgi:hypothetical protein